MQKLNQTLSGLRSLKARIALAVGLMFAVVITGIVVAQLHQTRESMGHMLADQQTTLVNRTAEDIDDKFQDRKDALAATAIGLAGPLEARPENAQLLLRDREALATMFDTVILLDAEGNVKAVMPDRPELHRVNLKMRPYFQDTVRLRKGVVSQPYRGIASNRPFVTVTAPIVDNSGKLIFVLTGAINLLQPNFIGSIGDTQVGKTGYFYVVTRGENAVVVSHPIKERILGPAVPKSGNSAAARAQEGFEGTIEGTNSRGIAGLMSFKRLKEADWILAAVFPEEEAFAPIRESGRRTIALGIASMVVVLVLTWLLVYRSLRPLDALRSNIHLRLAGERTTLFEASRNDEIGNLAIDFNRLMEMQRAAEEMLRGNEERLRTITDNIPVIVGYVDSALRYRFANYAYDEWFGIPCDRILGQTIAELMGERSYAAIEPRLREALDGYPVTFEYEFHARGRTRFVQASYLPDYGERSAVVGIYVLIHDITSRRQAEDQLRHLAHHDFLTQLPNRIAIKEHLDAAVRRPKRTGKACAVMYLDIDKFKSINDTFGHAVGDELLRQFARRLQRAVRDTDIVGRLGGDEFVIIAENISTEDDARVIARKIVHAMQEPFDCGSGPMKATTSVGVALCRPEDRDCQGPEMLERADAALYAAKAAGRNTFSLAEALEVRAG